MINNAHNLKVSNSLKHFLILGATVIFFMFLMYEFNDLLTLSKISIVLWLFIFVTWTIIEKDIINFYSFFLIFIFMFFLGDFFLYAIDFNFNNNRNITSGLVPFSAIKISLMFLMKFLLIMHFSVLIVYYYLNKKGKKVFKEKKQISNKMLEALKIASTIIFVITFIPSFDILFRNIYITFTQGYGEIFNSVEYSLGGFANIKRFISSFFIPNLFLMLIVFKNTKYIKLISFIVIIYLGLYFLSGSRINAILIISAFIMIKHYWYSKISKKGYVYLTILLIVMSVLLPLISELRNILFKTGLSQEMFISIFNNLIDQNPIFTSLEESGYTFLVIATVINNVGINVEYLYGMSYMNNVLMIFPNLFWDVHPATSSNTDLAFQDFLTIYGGVGSSFVAEAYYNFGKYSIILAIFFGTIVSHITYKIKSSSENKDVIIFYIYVYASSLLLIYVRSDTVSFLRNMILYAITPLVLGWFISKLGRKNEREL
ncbi:MULTISPECIES: O-antigen polysaccharide polymerase Wzy [Exiguobacterium]|uniref:O-antigen polysaccharide polymerase Wzy n=1 Tax=Exiguobacterium sp. UBA1053 TaxID=1946487 RepID=UPI0025C3FDDD|nr:MULTISPECIES: O-antigen polysaccharide polymerase Wzy [Exiguobacterium]